MSFFSRSKPSKSPAVSALSNRGILKAGLLVRLHPVGHMKHCFAGTVKDNISASASINPANINSWKREDNTENDSGKTLISVVFVENSKFEFTDILSIRIQDNKEVWTYSGIANNNPVYHHPNFNRSDFLKNN